MPFYSNDSINTWLFTCFEERYETMNEEEQQEFVELILNSSSNLKGWCRDQIETSGAQGSIVEAIMNTVEWGDLYQELMAWVEAQDSS